MYSFRKSKKGFTLIELMVVVAIIGVLALLGLRVYIGQQNKAKNAIVIANASTVHTLIQGDMLDHDYPTSDGKDDSSTTILVLKNIDGTVAAGSNNCTALANMKNPFAGLNIAVYNATDLTGTEGEVIVNWISTNEFEIQAIGADGEATGEILTAIK